MSEDENLLDELIEDQQSVESQKRSARLLPKRGAVLLIGVVIGLVLFTSLQQQFRSKQSAIAEHYHQPDGGRSFTPQELSHLIYMREEEKLALDVYQFLAQRWGQRIFFSISQSEQRHTTAIARLLNQYGLADPALNRPAGVFQNAELSKLYQTLITRGQQSLLDALYVGALIEEVDINDLDRAIQDSNHRTVSTVYRRIQNGSYHHLRAFVHSIEVTGGRYQAQLLPQTRVDQIVSGALTAF